jgi:hypothetical protein
MTSFRFAFMFGMWLFWSGSVHAVDIAVRLVYLNNGKPAQGQQAVLYEGDPSHTSTIRMKETTSSDGIAIFHLSEPLPKTVWVDENNGVVRGCAWENQIPLRNVIEQGTTIGVDERFGGSCRGDRSAINRLRAKPGEIVIFVRKLSVWDNLHHY